MTKSQLIEESKERRKKKFINIGSLILPYKQTTAKFKDREEEIDAFFESELSLIYDKAVEETRGILENRKKLILKGDKALPYQIYGGFATESEKLAEKEIRIIDNILSTITHKGEK